MPNEADTCRLYVVPKLSAAGWDTDQIREQVTFTDGRIIVTERTARRRPGKRADYILRYRPDIPIAVVEAKPTHATPRQGVQQAKDYAETLGLKFAYSTNRHGIVEHDYLTGIERELDTFPGRDELWQRLTQGEKLSPEAAQQILAPSYEFTDKKPRYYQKIAINGAIQAIAQGRRRILLTLTTGTGKTFMGEIKAVVR